MLRSWMSSWAGFSVVLGVAIAGCEPAVGTTAQSATGSAEVPGPGGGFGPAAAQTAESTAEPEVADVPAPGQQLPAESQPVAEQGAAGAGGTAMPAVAEAPTAASDDLRDVLMVGNGVSGTVSFVDPHTFENLGSIDVLPDYDEVMQAISLDLVRFIAQPIIKNNQLLHHFEPSEGDRFVDDLFVSPDGETLYVSRSNLGDVAAFDIGSEGQPRLWRTFVSGLKADHAAISPDGTRLAVSATTANVVDVLDAATGDLVGTFPTGNFPHQNDYTPDGRHIYNSSIGNVGYNVYSYDENESKGDKWLVKVDAQTLEVVDTWVFEWGIRPNVFSADERFLYTQLSYLNGVVKYDLEAKAEVARNEQPLSEFALETYASYDEYPHDSAHHGLAISGDGSRLCDCGTVDNTVAIIDAESMETLSLVDVGMVPYWATTGPEGRYCFVSLSGDNTLAVIDYESGAQVAEVPVGAFPQRNRLARVPARVIDMLQPSNG
jgi:DNA-binding beta-propeller fold protein YncE